MLTIEVVTAPYHDTTESDYIRQKLYALHGGPGHAALESVNLYLRDPDGGVCGGLLGQMYWNCMFADILWVDPQYRGMGYGRRLMNELEAVARGRGLDLIHLDAPGDAAAEFHSRLGFEVYGTLDDTPIGRRRYFMVKRLV